MWPGYRESQIKKYVLDALLQFEAVTRCEKHGEVLLHNCDAGAENQALQIVPDWLDRHAGLEDIDPIEIREEIAAILERAAKDGCPKCSQQEDG